MKKFSLSQILQDAPEVVISELEESFNKSEKYSCKLTALRSIIASQDLIIKRLNELENLIHAYQGAKK